MLDWPKLASLKSLRGFLGITGFYRRFIHNYAKIPSPLTALLKQGQFQWNSKADTAFIALQNAMTHAHVLTLPDFNIPFIIETDASGSGMGAVLLQNKYHIAYFSKQFCAKLLCSSTYIRELHAITTTVKRWHQYLLGRAFTIMTDHKSLKELMSQHIQTPEQQVYLTKLLGYDYTIMYKAGSHNLVADALSRAHESTAEGFWLLTPQFKFLEDLKKELSSNSEFITLRDKVLNNPQEAPDYQFIDGLLLFKGHIWWNKGNSFIPLFLSSFMNSISLL